MSARGFCSTWLFLQFCAHYCPLKGKSWTKGKVWAWTCTTLFFFLAESNIFLCGWHPSLTPVTPFSFLFDSLTFTVQCLCRIAQTVKFRFIRLALISQGLPQRMDPYCLIWHRFKGRCPSWRNPSFYLCLRNRCLTICVSSWFRTAEFSRVKRMR